LEAYLGTLEHGQKAALLLHAIPQLSSETLDMALALALPEVDVPTLMAAISASGARMEQPE
jgi:hypothetical protein